MNIDSLIQSDKTVVESLRKFFTDPNFERIRSAFTSHSESSNQDGVKVAHGKYLGTRFVFNKIEETMTKPSQSEKPKTNTGAGKPDPDLDTTRR